MQEPAHPWRSEKPLAQILRESRSFLESHRIIEPGGGPGEQAVVSAEKRMGRALPPDVREFYLTVRPVHVFLDDRLHDFGFYQLNEPQLAWRSMAEAEPAEDWVDAEGLAIGQGIFGDPFWWIKGHRWFSDGCIVVYNHDGGFGEIPFTRVANSLAEFVAKTAFFGKLDPPSGTDERGRELESLHREDFQRLNVRS